jgi:phage/plasmid primase-like uncharacterized protein
MTLTELTNGRWPDLLMQLAGLTPDQLTDTHQPCPLCGGEDRYRFDDLNGTGSWYCNQCGGKDQSGGGGSGIDMLMRRTGLTYPEACKRIEQHLNISLSRQLKALSISGSMALIFLSAAFQAKRSGPYGGMAHSGYGKHHLHRARYTTSMPYSSGLMHRS